MNTQRHPAQRGQRKAHRHAVIVVGVDAGRLPYPGWRNRQEIRALLDLRAQLAQLAGHGGDAIGFLDPPAADIAQPAGALGKQGQHRRCHGGIRNVVQIHVQRLQMPGAPGRWAGFGFDPVRPHAQLATHALEHLGKAHITLDAVAPHALDPHRRAARPLRQQAAQDAGGQKIRGRGRVALDKHRPWRLIVLRRHIEGLPTVAHHRDAKAPHQGQGEFDIGLGDQLAHHLDALRPPGQRQRHQQGREELR